MYQPSTPPSMTPRIGRFALNYGVIAGVCLGLTHSILSFIPYNSYSALSGPFILLLWVAVFLLVGALAGKRTGKTSVGTLTGLWTGLIGGAITAVIQFGDFFIHGYGYSADVIALMLTSLILFVLFTMGVGTGLGALGGLIGQSFFTTATTSVLPNRQSDPPQSEI
jgi:hypothetical protein